MPRTTITPRLMVLYDQDGNEFPAIALGTTSADAVEALALLKAGALEQVGQDPSRVSPVAAKTYKHPVKRADNEIVEYTVGVSLAVVKPKNRAAKDAPAIL